MFWTRKFCLSQQKRGSLVHSESYKGHILNFGDRVFVKRQLLLLLNWSFFCFAKSAFRSEYLPSRKVGSSCAYINGRVIIGSSRPIPFYLLERGRLWQVDEPLLQIVRPNIGKQRDQICWNFATLTLSIWVFMPNIGKQRDQICWNFATLTFSFWVFMPNIGTTAQPDLLKFRHFDIIFLSVYA